MQRHKPGFTLIEIAIVVTVIAVLASITIMAFNYVQKRSRDDTRTTQAQVLATALNRYFDENGEYPNVCPGGTDSPCSSSQYLTPVLVPKYIQTIPDQPTGNPYQYIRGASPDSYGVLVEYENVWRCKTGKNMQQTAAWWGSDGGWAPNCGF